ncbi:MAG: flavodoxin-dependent (E)-4-hydroxy-3-methylbut-2-enyl-diphosphate synthase [Elusimicrobiota bacterium]
MLTREIQIGDLKLGGDNPVRVQGMLKEKLDNPQKLIEEGKRMIDAGAELVRCAIPKKDIARSVYKNLKTLGVPLIADCHFQSGIGEQALEAGFEKIRVNPGNTSREGILKIVELAGKKDKAIRLGFNTGSCAAENGVELARMALEWDKEIFKTGFKNYLVSLKSSSVKDTIEANRYFSVYSDTPLHIGVTATGMKKIGLIKSSVGVGSLLMDKIGDTVRVSITGDSKKEVETGMILKELAGNNMKRLEIISCPACSRSHADVQKMVNKFTDKLKKEDFKRPYKIAIMGCEVNGPGEAKEADIGICYTRKGSLFISEGNIEGKIKRGEELSKLLEYLRKL